MKVSFVLDTEFDKKISKSVEGAEVLITESSFIDGSDNGNALAKEHLHLTAKQAGEIAKKGKVGKLLLTHISQRYEHNPNAILK